MDPEDDDGMIPYARKYLNDLCVKIDICIKVLLSWNIEMSSRNATVVI